MCPLGLTFSFNFSFFTTSSSDKRTIARLKGLAFHFDQMSPCRCAPLPSEFSGGCVVACSNNRILSEFVAQGLAMERYGVAFFYWSKAFEKTGFWKSITNFCAKKKTFFSDLETFTFSNACAIQSQYMYQGIVEKKLLDNMGYWQNGSENEKRYVAIRQRWVD